MSNYPEIWNEKNFRYLSINELRYQNSYFEEFKSENFKTQTMLEKTQKYFFIFLFVSFWLMILYSVFQSSFQKVIF